MTGRKKINKAGFTLIEIIVTVVIVAILGAMIITFLSDSLIKSSDPVKRLQKTSDLNRIMANITADYNRYPKWRSETAYDAGNFVIPTIRNGHFYTSGGGTSGLTEPNWPPTTLDGNTTWTDSGSLSNLPTLKTKIGTENTDQNTYSSDATKYYHIDRNRFVLFNSSGSEIDDTIGLNNILKVTIRNDQGVTLTALFLKGQNE